MSQNPNHVVTTEPFEAIVTVPDYQARPFFSLSFCGWLAHSLNAAIDQRVSLLRECGEPPSLADVQSVAAALEGIEILAGFDPARASSIDCEIIALAIGAMDRLGYEFAI